MKILLIDAYDSFVHIIYQYLLKLDAEVDVVRNDKINDDLIKAGNYDLLILGPGPGHPQDSGYLEIINSFKDEIPIFGICLGMQAIVMAFGGEVVKSGHIMHGKTSLISHDEKGLFENLNNPLEVARYHSLIAKQSSFPSSALQVISTANDDGHIMALKHKDLSIQGVQFHPESIITKDGASIFKNLFQLF
ncbi:aminodeoxychorismate/anthranilate synthase component II [Francisellaceae bacterium]|nr:aminodeoxychorismate/anthranilate synthase component II [Francisellaceae bacterium]